MTDPNAAKMNQTCTALYAVFAAVAISGFIPLWSVVILATIALFVAVGMAYSGRKTAGDSIYESHFHWLIRTFWIGGWVYLPALTLVAVIAVYFSVDWSDVEAAIRTAAMEHVNGTPDEDKRVVVNTVMEEVMQKNGAKIGMIVFAFIFPAVAWWLWRCWKGFNLLKKGQPVTDVMKWV